MKDMSNKDYLSYNLFRRCCSAFFFCASRSLYCICSLDLWLQWTLATTRWHCNIITYWSIALFNNTSPHIVTFEPVILHRLSGILNDIIELFKSFQLQVAFSHSSPLFIKQFSTANMSSLREMLDVYTVWFEWKETVSPLVQSRGDLEEPEKIST